MVRIRLKRVGGKKHPFYRIVIADQRAARDGAFIDQVGTYDPFPDPPEIKIDEEKVAEWMKKGAQPSDSVISLFRTKGILPRIGAAATAEQSAKAAAPKAASKPATKATPKAVATATAVADPPEEASEEVKAEDAPEEAKAEEVTEDKAETPAEDADKESSSD